MNRILYFSTVLHLLSSSFICNLLLLLILCPMYSCVLTAFTIRRISINQSIQRTVYSSVICSDCPRVIILFCRETICFTNWIPRYSTTTNGRDDWRHREARSCGTLLLTGNNFTLFEASKISTMSIKWSKYFVKRPHRRRTRTVQSYSLDGANVHLHLIRGYLGSLEFTTETASRSI